MQIIKLVKKKKTIVKTIYTPLTFRLTIEGALILLIVNWVWHGA